MVDSALRSRTVRRAELVSAAEQGPRTGRAKALRVIAVGTKDAANPFESVLRAVALDVAGLNLIAQGPVGPVWHADLADLGRLVARFVWEDVMERPTYVQDVLRDLVVLRLQEAVGRLAG